MAGRSDGPVRCWGRAKAGCLRLADLAIHEELVAIAHDDARLVLERDPQLESERGRALRPSSTSSAATKRCNTCATAASAQEGPARCLHQPVAIRESLEFETRPPPRARCKRKLPEIPR